jgi:hypothetical protein
VQGRAIALALTALIAMLVIAPAAAPAASKKGKVNVCVEKRGKDRGAMRFAGKKRCHKGEKKVTFAKKGKPGPAGQRGPEGPAGPAGSAADLTALRAELEAQIAALQGQLTGLSTQFAAFQTAACAQLATLTDQTNALGTALDGIGLGGTIPALLTLVNPGAPPGLPAFSC